MTLLTATQKSASDRTINNKDLKTATGVWNKTDRRQNKQELKQPQKGNKQTLQFTTTPNKVIKSLLLIVFFKVCTKTVKRYVCSICIYIQIQICISLLLLFSGRPIEEEMNETARSSQKSLIQSTTWKDKAHCYHTTNSTDNFTSLNCKFCGF